MKKYLLLLLAFMFITSTNSIAQKFECMDFVSKQAKWNAIKKSSNKNWAKEVIKQFPLNLDGDIYYKYTVFNNCNMTIKEMTKRCDGFLKSILNLEKGAEINIDTINNICYGEGKWANVGQVIGLYNATIIHAELKIRIKIYKDSLTFETKVPHYILGAFDLFKNGAESNLISPKDVFPSNLNGNHKESYSQAFINCNAYSYNIMSSFLSYLNKHIDDKIIDTW